MIEVESLTKRYGPQTAVDGLTFGVSAGEIVGFLGPNGAGKTTTIRMITGFVVPSEGRVAIDGRDVHEAPREARGRFGYLPEGVPMYREMRVREYLRYRAKLKGIPRREAASEAERVLTAVDVADVAERIIGQLSKGYRQRVGLADALIGDPPLLVLDEPMSGLDPNQARHIRGLLRTVAEDKAVFLSTHLLSEVEAICDRVLIVREGRKIEEGTPAEIRERLIPQRAVMVRGAAELPALSDALAGAEGIAAAEVREDAVRVTLDNDADEGAIFRAAVAAGTELHFMAPAEASLEDIFATLTTRPDADAEDVDGLSAELGESDESGVDDVDADASDAEAPS